MYVCATSGQILGLNFISAFSGTPLTGLSGFISGYKTVDLQAQAGISGYIIEAAFGQYVARLFDYDVSGSIISYYFTAASGAIPIEKTVVTTLNTSGDIYTASGVNVTVPIASISGAVGNSGQFVSVPVATLSGVVANSGLFVTVPIATISGLTANSGLFVSVPPATISGVVANSGLFVNALPISGQVYLASGSITSGVIVSGIFVNGSFSLASGALSGQQVTLVSGQSYTASGINTTVPPSSLSGVVANSGLFVTVPITSISGAVGNSGQFVTVPPGTLSGVVANSGLFVNSLPLSGQVFLASGSVTSGVISSGIFVTATASVQSGQIYLASGSFLFGSGQFFLASGSVTSGVISSGIFVTATAAAPASGTTYLASGHFLFGSGQFFVASGSITSGVIVSGIFVNGSFSLASGALSGQQVTLVSGQSYTASGINANVPPSSLSGVTVNSGLNVTVPIASISGVNSVVPPASLSGVVVNSGLFVTVPIATISGVQTASGITVVVPPGTLSGLVVNSGLFVNSLPLSGQVYLASGSVTSGVISSGIFVTATAAPPASGTTYLASGSFLFGSGQFFAASGQSVSLNSGQVALLASGQLSGQVVTTRTNLDKSGYTLTASGLDTIQVESGVNFRQSQSINFAVLAGRLSGAGTATVLFDGGNVSGTNRVTAAVNQSGDRTSVTLNLPT